MKAAHYQLQKDRILRQPAAADCHLVKTKPRVGEFMLIDRSTNCVVYPFDTRGEGAPLHEIEKWVMGR